MGWFRTRRAYGEGGLCASVRKNWVGSQSILQVFGNLSGLGWFGILVYKWCLWLGLGYGGREIKMSFPDRVLISSALL